MLRAPLPVVLAAACVVVSTLSLLIPAAPSYDPWSWLVWGREVLQGDLRTETGPSWKPLPVLFTAPFSLFGDAAPSMWMVVARAFALGSAVVAGALGLRLAGWAGALLAGVPLAVVPFLWRPVLLGGSEGALVFFVLLAVQRHLAAREGQAFACGVAAAMLRPEAWPFLGLYALWLLYRDRRRLWWIAVGLALIPVLWLLPELWGSGSLWRAAERAQETAPNAPARADRPSLEVLKNFLDRVPSVVLVGLALGGLAVLLRRVPRERALAAGATAALGVAWLALVMAMTEAGFSGIERYLTMPLAIAIVLGGIGCAWVLSLVLAAAQPRALRAGTFTVLAVVLAVGYVRLTGGWADSLSFVERHGQVTWELDDAISRAGGERQIEECGDVYASFLLTPPVAWELEKHLEEVTAWPHMEGTILRARLLVSQPLKPLPGWYAKRPNARMVARTEFWSVEQACVSG